MFDERYRGNEEGVRPYPSGSSCSACPSGTHCVLNLCSKKGMTTQEPIPTTTTTRTTTSTTTTTQRQTTTTPPTTTTTTTTQHPTTTTTIPTTTTTQQPTTTTPTTTSTTTTPPPPPTTTTTTRTIPTTTTTTTATTQRPTTNTTASQTTTIAFEYISQTERDALLSYHNNKRASVKPTATGMMKLVSPFKLGNAMRQIRGSSMNWNVHSFMNQI